MRSRILTHRGDDLRCFDLVTVSRKTPRTQQAIPRRTESSYRQQLPKRWRVEHASHAPKLVQPTRDAELGTRRRDFARRSRHNSRWPAPREAPRHHPAPASCRTRPPGRRSGAHRACRTSLPRLHSGTRCPSSSAFTRAKFTHFTMVNQAKSSARVTGPSGSFEMTSGQDDGVCRAGKFQAFCIERGLIPRQHIALTGLEGTEGLRGRSERRAPRTSSSWHERNPPD